MRRLARDHLLAAAAICLAAAGAVLMLPAVDDRPALETLRAGKPLRAGYAIEPPYAFRSPTQRITGEAPEVLRAVIGKISGAEVEWVYADFPALTQDLLAGRIDVIAAGMFVTPERQQRMIFSRPTARVCAALLTATANAAGVQSFKDIAASERFRLAVLLGSVEQRQALEAGIPADRVEDFPDAATALQAVQQGRADGLALSAPSLRNMLERAPDEGLTVIPLSGGTPGLPAFAFRPGETALRDAVDARLAGFLGTPMHREVVGRFGFTEDEVAASSATGAGRCGD